MPEPSPSTVPPNLLIVEDNLELQKEIRQEAEAAGWTPIATRSRDEAEEILLKHASSLCLMILDVMVLKSREYVGKVDALVGERERFVWSKTGGGVRTDFNLDELHTIRKQLAEYDRDIHQYVDYDGGLNFLEWAKKAGLLNGIRVAIFTARDSAKEGIRERIQACVKSENFVEWLSKPRDPQALVDLLKTEFEKL